MPRPAQRRDSRCRCRNRQTSTDRRGALEREIRLDRVLELLGVAAVRRVEHAIEDRSYYLRLRREEPTVHISVDEGLVRVEAPRVVGVPPVERRVHRKPLPLLEGKANLRREVETLCERFPLY